jgi:hypothetical protein
MLPINNCFIAKTIIEIARREEIAVNPNHKERK